MKNIVTTALLIAGAINFYPLIGVISADQLVTLYGVPLENNDLIILMRHRAVLFGLLGAFIIYAAFRDSIQIIACIAGLISMLTFIVIAYAVGDFGTLFNKIIIADVVGSVALIAVILIRMLYRPHNDRSRSSA